MLAGLDPTIDPAVPIRTLRVAQQQIVEIARALMDDAKIIAMDEPTSSLTPSEFERLAELIARLAARGEAVIYVSHKMDEVFRVCHRATILRDGRKVAVVEIGATTQAEVVAQMVGRDIATAGHRSFATGEEVLRVTGLTRGAAVIDASLTLHRGEVLGISGLVGAGRTELLRLIAGIDRPSAGTVHVARHGARPLRAHDPRAAIRCGIGLVPEERKREGIVHARSIASNMALPSMRRFARAGVIRRRKLEATAREVMSDLRLRPLDLRRAIGTFSGGNQQKAIIGRWIAASTEVLLFDEPTRGIDVGAKAEIYTLIERLAAEGKAILVVSSELPEIIRLADRVLVMREGRIVADLARAEISEAAIVAQALPVRDTPDAAMSSEEA